LYHSSFNIELIPQFFRPLVSQVGRTQDAYTTNYASVKQLPGHHCGLNGLANPYIIGDEQTDWVLSQGHDQWHVLVRPGRNRQSANRPKRPCAAAQGKSNGVP
jgi:hypothetical protein